MVKIGLIAQKGGVGKSTLAAMIGRTYAEAGWKVLLADMDNSQSSLVEWNALRRHHQIAPALEVRSFERVSEALVESAYDLIVFDGAPHASQATAEIASVADLVILPTGSSIMDLNPQIKLAHELTERGLDPHRLLFVLSRVGQSKVEYQEVIEYLTKTGYAVTQGSIPEKTAFRRCFIEGKTLTEVPYPTLKKRCEQLLQSIVDRVNEITN